jgi:hypothetical protein
VRTWRKRKRATPLAECASGYDALIVALQIADEQDFDEDFGPPSTLPPSARWHDIRICASVHGPFGSSTTLGVIRNVYV